MSNGSGKTEYRFLCPVCGKPLGDYNLPTIEGVFTDDFFYHRKDRIINSTITIEHYFDHYRDEETGTSLGECHPLLSVIEAEFDSAGNIIHFNILEIRPVKDEVTP